MRTKTLITGLPQSGKSTLILKLIEFIKTRRIHIKGFLTPEIRKGNKRIGFDVIDITTKERVKLARTGDYKTGYRMGKYSVFIKEFEKIIINLEKNKIQDGELIIIDEIGKMELFSSKFQNIIKIIFSSNISILATIGLKLQHSLKDYILQITNIHFITLNRQNFDHVFQKVSSILSQANREKSSLFE